MSSRSRWTRPKEMISGASRPACRHDTPSPTSPTGGLVSTSRLATQVACFEPPRPTQSASTPTRGRACRIAPLGDLLAPRDKQPAILCPARQSRAAPTRPHGAARCAPPPPGSLRLSSTKSGLGLDLFHVDSFAIVRGFANTRRRPPPRRQILTNLLVEGGHNQFQIGDKVRLLRKPNA